MGTRSIFVISPIGSAGTPEHRRYRHTLEYIVKKAFAEPDWQVVRADEETSPDSITTQVIGRIVESDLIIADLTDHNPNVFYELAVAHGYRKPVIHMMEDGQKVPFDVVDQRVIFYDLTDPESVDKAQRGLKASAQWLDDNAGQSRNPLSSYGQFSAISSASGGGEVGEAVADALSALSRQVARLDQRIRDREPSEQRASQAARINEMVNHLTRLEAQADAVKASHGPGYESAPTYRELQREISDLNEYLKMIRSGI